MGTSNRPQYPAPAAVIDPAKAWMLGVLVEEDGSLRPAPAPALSWGTRERDGRREVARPCTCPDFCEAEHGIV
jgi:hypothetical protein